MAALLHYGSLAKTIVGMAGIVARTPTVNPTRAFNIGRQDCAREKSAGDSPPQQSSREFELMNGPRICPGRLSSYEKRRSKNQDFQERVIAQLDKEFSIKSFKQGATAALLTVSDVLASDDITSLKENGLLEENAYREVKANHDRMSVVQRSKLRIAEEDIFAKLIHGARIIQDDETGKRAVEIFISFGACDPSNGPFFGIFNPADGLSMGDDDVSHDDLLEEFRRRSDILFKVDRSQVKSLGFWRFFGFCVGVGRSLELVQRGYVCCNLGLYRDYSNAESPSPWVLTFVNYFQPRVDERSFF